MRMIVSYYLYNGSTIIREIDGISTANPVQPRNHPNGVKAVNILFNRTWNSMSDQYILNGEEEVEYFQKQILDKIRCSKIIDLEDLVPWVNHIIKKRNT